MAVIGIRRELTLGAALCLALPGFGAAPAPADAIDAAAQQLQTLKADAAAGRAGNSTAALPSIALPELQETPSAPAPLLPNPALDKKKKPRSANWLVDGVMQAEAHERRARERARDGGNEPRRGDRDSLAPTSDSSSADATGLADGSGSTDATNPADPTGRADESADRPSRSERRESALDEAAPHRAANEPVFNPLTRFMSDWLAPQDNAALRDALGPAAPAGGGFAGAPAGRDAPAGSPLDVVLPGLGSDGGRGAAAYRPTKPADNPYLDALSAPPEPATSASVPADDGGAPAAIWAPPAQNAPSARPMEEPPKSNEPDFAKPFDDDKYYKPLKRF